MATNAHLISFRFRMKGSDLQHLLAPMVSKIKTHEGTDYNRITMGVYSEEGGDTYLVASRRDPNYEIRLERCLTGRFDKDKNCKVDVIDSKAQGMSYEQGAVTLCFSELYAALGAIGQKEADFVFENQALTITYAEEAWHKMPYEEQADCLEYGAIEDTDPDTYVFTAKPLRDAFSNANELLKISRAYSPISETSVHLHFDFDGSGQLEVSVKGVSSKGRIETGVTSITSQDDQEFFPECALVSKRLTEKMAAILTLGNQTVKWQFVASEGKLGIEVDTNLYKIRFDAVPTKCNDVEPCSEYEFSYLVKRSNLLQPLGYISRLGIEALVMTFSNRGMSLINGKETIVKFPVTGNFQLSQKGLTDEEQTFSVSTKAFLSIVSRFSDKTEILLSLPTDSREFVITAHNPVQDLMGVLMAQ